MIQYGNCSNHAMITESPHYYLYTDIFAISYTALNASDFYTAPPSPHFILPARYYDPGDHNCNPAGRGVSFIKCSKTLKLAIRFRVAAAVLVFLTQLRNTLSFCTYLPAYIFEWEPLSCFVSIVSMLSLVLMLLLNLLNSERKKNISMGKTYYIRKVGWGGV